MRQYTTPEQTAKLIELGFEKPSNTRHPLPSNPSYWEGAYSLAEMIAILEGDNYINIRRVPTKFSYAVVCFNRPSKRIYRGVHYKELIDALYAMILQLKEEGVI